MKKSFKWILKIVFTLALFILIFNPGFFGIQKQIIPVTLEALWDEIMGIDISVFWKWILVALIIKALGMLSSMARWNLLLKGQAIKLPFSHLIGTFLVGRFFGMFLPSTIGLDGYRLYDVAKHTGKVVESTAVILIEKIIGFIALTFLVFITLPLGLRFLPIKPLVLGAILFILAIFILFSLFVLFNPKIIQILIAVFPVPGRKKFQQILDKIARAVSTYSGQKMLLVQAVILGFFVHFCTALMYFATAMAIKTTNIDILDILFASPLMIYGTVIGPSIGGEGIREIVFALILGAKAGAAKAILFAHLGFWVGEILSLAGGIIFVIRPPEYRPRAEEINEILESSRSLSSQQIISPEGITTVKTNIKNALTSGIVSGIWAGFLVGIIEAVLILLSFQNLSEQTVLFYAPIMYSIFGGIMGAGWGLVSSGYALFISKRYNAETLWAISFVTVLTPLGFVITRFRIVRDVFHERNFSIVDNALLSALFVVVSIFLYWIGKKLLAIRPFSLMVKGIGTPFVFTFILLLFFGFNQWKGSFGKAQEPTWNEPPVKPAPNIIFIMADALRAANLSAYNYDKNHTPNIDSLARDGILFTRHFAQSSWTKPQTATLLTSLYPSTHNTYLKSHVLPGSIETLPEVLKTMGYRTGGIVTNINLSPIFNFQQGFIDYCYLPPDYFFFSQESSSKLCFYNLLRLVRERFFSKKKYVHHYYQSGEVVNEKAFAWLKKVKDSPFFLFLHYMDPHDPYFEHPYIGKGVARVSDPNPPADKAAMIQALYDGEITYMDKRIGELITFLKDNGMYDNCFILFTADHGEEFYDHGGWWHGTTLFDEQIHIPLIVKLPDNKKSGAVDTRMVRSIDVSPTIIAAAGGTVPDVMQGKNVLIQDEEDRGQVFAEEDHENNVIQTMRTEQWKLILTNTDNPRKLPPVMLFDMKNDPGEKKNISSDHPEIVSTLREKITAKMDAVKKSAYSAQKSQIDDATSERLKALGYVE